MKKRDLEFFRKLLRQRRQELLAEAEKALGAMDARENFPDPTDRAAVESDRNFYLRIRDRERKLLAKIDEALRRLEEGEYGTCEACGEPIGLERLKARPVTTLCIECKSAQEGEERKTRRYL